MNIELSNTNISAQENKEASDKLSLLVDETVNNIPNVEKIYLFGSYAYGKPNKDSDFDIMVVTENELEPVDILDRQVVIRDNLFYTVDDFDIIVYSAKTFNRRKEQYRFENKIFNEGKLLYLSTCNSGTYNLFSGN